MAELIRKNMGSTSANRLKKKYSIYALCCKENGKVYVGCTSDFETRIMTHMRELSKGTHSSAQLREDAEKYKADGFEVYLIAEDLSYIDGQIKEWEYIEKYHAKDPKYGYNGGHKRPSLLEKYEFTRGEPPIPAITASKQNTA